MGKLLVPLALMMVVLAGACGSSEDEGSSAKPPAERTPQEPTAVETVQVAYRQTAAAQTARTSFEATTTGPPPDRENSGQPEPMTMTMTGQGVVDFSGAASSMMMGMPGLGNMEMRQIGDVVYMKMPEDFLAQLPGAKPWIEVDLDAMYEQQYGASPVPTQGGAGDPARQLEYLRGVSDSVEKVGTERVRGVQTTHYEAVVDLEDAAAEGDAAVRETNHEIAKKLGTSKLPVEVWLDDQNRIRRYAMSTAVPVPENASTPGMPEDGKLRTSVVAEYYDFGTPVDVQAPPPPGQTTDGSGLLNGQQPVAR